MAQPGAVRVGEVFTIGKNHSKEQQESTISHNGFHDWSVAFGSKNCVEGERTGQNILKIGICHFIRDFEF